jgi:tetratricopeptide (TPR) repeat protein
MLKAYQTLTCTLFLLPAIALAENALLTGKADEALAALRTRLQIDPADAEAHNLMCRVYYQLERWDDSVHACERAVNLQPRNSEYHQWLGRAYGRRVEASGPVGALFMVRKVKAEFERAAALNADSLSARADLAEFYMEAPFFMGGDKTKARQLADYVAQRDPAQGQFMLAQIDEKKNKPKAETEFKSAVRASGGRADYWFELASFYRRSGRPEEMQLAVDKASDLSSKDPIVLFFCARLLLNAGRNYPGAVQMLRSYLSSGNFGEDGPAFQAHYILGSLLERQGDTRSAAAEFRSALALASLYKPARDALAHVSR